MWGGSRCWTWFDLSFWQKKLDETWRVLRVVWRLIIYHIWHKRNRLVYGASLYHLMISFDIRIEILMYYSKWLEAFYVGKFVDHSLWNLFLLFLVSPLNLFVWLLFLFFIYILTLGWLQVLRFLPSFSKSLPSKKNN